MAVDEAHLEIQHRRAKHQTGQSVGKDLSPKIGSHPKSRSCVKDDHTEKSVECVQLSVQLHPAVDNLEECVFDFLHLMQVPSRSQARVPHLDTPEVHKHFIDGRDTYFHTTAKPRCVLK